MRSHPLPVVLLLLAVTTGGAYGQTPSAHPASDVQQFALSTSTSAYRLGPGDQIEVNAFGVPELSTSRQILADGTASFPIIGSVRLSDLSPEGAAAELTELYRPYVEKLQLTVAVLSPRPMTISVIGEVNRPGPYTLGATGSVTSTKTGTGEGSTGGVGGGRLTVSQALNLAGGVSEDADIEQITLIRKLPGGNTTRKPINLWAVLQSGDTSQDVSLLDGDAVMVARAEPGKTNYPPEEVARSTLAPSTVEVKVLGEVRSPGTHIVAPNAIFTDAIVAAGGLSNDADPLAVQLLRLNRDGTVTRFQIAAVLEQGRDPQKNPPLKKGDLILVNRSFGGGLLRGFSEVFAPLFSLFNIFRFR